MDRQDISGNAATGKRMTGGPGGKYQALWEVFLRLSSSGREGARRQGVGRRVSQAGCAKALRQGQSGLTQETMRGGVSQRPGGGECSRGGGEPLAGCVGWQQRQGLD